MRWCPYRPAGTVEQRRSEVRHREELERWRFEIAREAASEAFQATAGRYRKIYAIEKLTGNCLQKIAYEQAEHSQATEDGFQKIREVTGLTDVMDIVHKFLNRDVEQEQLRVTVREAEVRLHSLREAEATGHDGESSTDAPELSTAPHKLTLEVMEHEQALARARSDHDQLRKLLENRTVLMGSITMWADRVSRSLSSFEDLGSVQSRDDVVPFFNALAQSVDRLLAQRKGKKLSKITLNTCSEEQHRLLSDKDFLRANCRVPAGLEVRPLGDDARHRSGAAVDDERQEMEVASERARLKHESKRATEREPHHSAGEPSRDVRQRELQMRGPNLEEEARSPHGVPVHDALSSSQHARQRLKITGTTTLRTCRPVSAGTFHTRRRHALHLNNTS